MDVIRRQVQGNLQMTDQEKTTVEEDAKGIIFNSNNKKLIIVQKNIII